MTDLPGHDRCYAIDSSKIRAEQGWAPRHTFEAALADTVDWYLGHANWVESVRSGAYREWVERNYGGAVVVAPDGAVRSRRWAGVVRGAAAVRRVCGARHGLSRVNISYLMGPLP